MKLNSNTWTNDVFEVLLSRAGLLTVVVALLNRLDASLKVRAEVLKTGSGALQLLLIVDGERVLKAPFATVEAELTAYVDALEAANAEGDTFWAACGIS